MALAAHWQGADAVPPYCAMHIEPPGYTGIAPTGPGEVNVVLVVDQRDIQGQNIGPFYEKTVLGHSPRAELLGDARPAEKVRTVNSLSYAVAPPPVGGLILVGDAMGFIDPFTGEGIYLSLRSAEMAAQVLSAGLLAGDVSRRRLQTYELERTREFRRKFILSRVLERLLRHRRACVKVVRALCAKPKLAQTLVGVIGDYLPAENAVSAKFLMQLLPAVLMQPAGPGRPRCLQKSTLSPKG